jgi:putative hydrolase of the HAD superfamily
MKAYKHIFFDLDRTLWDFDKSAAQIFEEIFKKYNLSDLGIPSVEIFVETYKKHNDVLWAMYRDGEIIKEVLSVKRWFLTLEGFNIVDGDIAAKIAEDYIRLSPLKINLFPYTIEILEYLKAKYQLHLITNGFEEVQTVKLRSGDLRKYFQEVITSEMAGYKKPDARIFQFALDNTGANIDESIMIGDDLRVDILGAKAMSIDQVYVNYESNPHEESITFEINNLKELENIL